LVDQVALVAALKTGHVALAGLDVFEREPLLPNDEIVRLPNVVLTSHIAALTEHAVARMVDQVVCGLRELASGRIPDGCVNPEIFANSRARTDLPSKGR
jgi:D-3-phosphoglycerate dehydrogenase